MTENRKLVHNQGVTLIEVIFYAALLTILLGLTTTFLHQVANFKVNNQINSSLFQNTNLAMTKITQDVRKADSVTTPGDENFVNTLVLETDSGQITYQVNNGILERNSVALTDEKVEVNLEPPARGFRKIGQTLQMKISFKARLKPFGQAHKEQNYQTSIFLNE